jgi:hypothetical protein
MSGDIQPDGLWGQKETPLAPKNVNAHQHACHSVAIWPTAKKCDNQNERQRHQPNDRKHNNPPKNADQALKDESKNTFCNCFQHGVVAPALRFFIQKLKSICHALIHGRMWMLEWIFGAIISSHPKNLQAPLLARRWRKLPVTGR